VGTSSQEALYRYFSAQKVSLAEPEPAPVAETRAPGESSIWRDARAWLKKIFVSE
jgi:hypothetical protein